MIDATDFLAEIDGYSKRTGTPAYYLGRLGFNHPGYVQLVRKRGRTSEESAALIREIMARYPDGIPEEELARGRLRDVRSPAARRKVEATLATLAEKRATLEARERVSRDPCGFCGVRGDIGCEHSRRWPS